MKKTLWPKRKKYLFELKQSCCSSEPGSICCNGETAEAEESETFWQIFHRNQIYHMFLSNSVLSHVFIKVSFIIFSSKSDRYVGPNLMVSDINAYLHWWVHFWNDTTFPSKFKFPSFPASFIYCWSWSLKQWSDFKMSENLLFNFGYIDFFIVFIRSSTGNYLVVPFLYLKRSFLLLSLKTVFWE